MDSTDANNVGLDTVMNTIQHGEFQPGIMSVDLRNLVPGTSYKLQLLFEEAGGSRRFNIYFNGQLLENNFKTSSGSSNIGTVVTYDFVATATGAVISLDGSETVSNDRNPILNAFTLEENPSDYTQSAGVLNLAGGTGALTLSGSMNLVNSTAKFSGNVTVSGAIGGTGTGVAVLQTGTGSTTLIGNNTYIGTTMIPSGTIIAGSLNALGAATGATTITGGTLAFAGGVTVGPEPVVVVPSASPTIDAIANLSGNNTFTGTIGQPLPIATAGSVDIGSAAGTLTLAGNVTLDGQNLIVDGAGATDITGNVVGATVLQNSFSQTVLATPGLVAYWKLDDAPSSMTGVDSSGNGNNLTYGNPTAGEFGQPGALAGDADTAITLDGTDQYASIPSDVFQFPGGGDQTFETWFKTTSSGVILSVTGNGSVPGVTGNFNGWVPALYVGTDGKVYASMFWHGATGDQVVSSGTYNDGNWHYVADVYSGGTESLYIDGSLVGTRSGDSQSDFNGGRYSYYLGTGFTNGWTATNTSWFYFNGSLDDTAVYNTSLSAATISSHAAFLTTGPINSSFSLTKKGSGTLTLGGTNSYAGVTSVSAGTLLVDGSIAAASAVSVSPGATLGGSGTVGTVSGPGLYSPGTATPGTLTTAGVSLGAGTLVIDLASATSFDQLDDAAPGTTVDITGTTLSLNVGAIGAPETFTILSVPGSDPASLVGTFVNLPTDGSTFTIGGEKFTINYAGGDGNDVVLTAEGAANATLVSTVLNGGVNYIDSTLASHQHSMVENVVYSFSQAVNLTTANFALTGINGTTAAPNVALASSGNGTVWTVTFTGTGVNNATHSIGDGEYQLVLNGVPGGLTSTFDFFRLLGDMDGNGTVDSADFSIFISSFLRSTSDPAYLGADDFDGNNTVDSSDFSIFVSNFLHSLPNTTTLN
jgi:autotransporter-associated beta strand protein